MTGQKITILAIDEISDYVLEHIASSLRRTFRLNTYFTSWSEFSTAPLEDFLYRLKCNSTEMLNYLSKGMQDKTGKILAITQLDLYSPIFMQLYGEAQLRGACALMSLYRLHEEGHRVADREVFLSRCEKEAIHEIGHTFGLRHCKDKNCIMYPSSKITDTDEKSNAFCSTCKAQIPSYGKY